MLNMLPGIQLTFKYELIFLVSLLLGMLIITPLAEWQLPFFYVMKERVKVFTANLFHENKLVSNHLYVKASRNKNEGCMDSRPFVQVNISQTDKIDRVGMSD